MAQGPYLTVAEVADELEITTNGVYKLIQRGRLPAIKRSERGTRVARWTLDAYKQRLAGHGPDTRRRSVSDDSDALRQAFERETGSAPEEWIARWKAGEIEDDAEHASLLVRALGMRTAEGNRPAWADAALASR